MGKVVIRKRIDLDFIGKDYEGGWVEFQSLSVKDVQSKLDEIKNVGDDGKLAVSLMIDLLSDCFLGGVFKYKDTEEKLGKEDIQDFDVPSITKFFTILTGQDGDPKV